MDKIERIDRIGTDVEDLNTTRRTRRQRTRMPVTMVNKRTTTPIRIRNQSCRAAQVSARLARQAVRPVVMPVAGARRSSLRLMLQCPFAQYAYKSHRTETVEVGVTVIVVALVQRYLVGVAVIETAAAVVGLEAGTGRGSGTAARRVQQAEVLMNHSQ